MEKTGNMTFSGLENKILSIGDQAEMDLWKKRFKTNLHHLKPLYRAKAIRNVIRNRYFKDR
ncbi:TPA: hypothetical protein HA338_15120 [Methanosarcina acetivorans]|uniref:Uncharacterized protein n=1 Tax=Methanosarcina acetivorans TaxID=2214 RepID=A0A832SL41_9EURY|nr:hypothetical protein [Methanosarcina acetivorans]HIH95292.1 hypothetical protein [Methanosarcina acetivorans]